MDYLFHTRMCRRFVAGLVFCLIISARAFSAGESPQSFTYQGQLTNAAGTAPLVDIVDLVVGVYSKNDNCLLYEEDQTVDLTQTAGLFSIQIGTGTRTTNDPGKTFAQVFANTGVPLIAAASPHCAPGYTPAAGDTRYLRFTITPQSTGVPNTLSPDQVVNSVPQALVAETLQGKDATQFLQPYVAGNLSQTTLQLLTSNLDASSLHNHDSRYIQMGSSAGSQTIGGVSINPAAGSTSLSVAGASGQTGNLVNVANASGTPFFTIDHTGTVSLGANDALGLGTFSSPPVGLTASDAGKMWYEAGTIQFWNGSAVSTLGVSGAGLQSLNSQTGTTQTFANGTTGTAPSFSSASNVHTLNIPNANTATVTDGLLSNTDYTTFAAKVDGKAALTHSGAIVSVDVTSGAVKEAAGITSGTTANVSQLVVKAGSAQGVNALSVWQNNSGTPVYTLNSSGTPSASTDLVTVGSVGGSVNWAVPGTIGSTTPNTGAFSTLSSSGAATLNSVAITNGATVGTTLGVTGNTTVGGTLGVTGNTTLTGTLGAGASTLNSATITNGATVGTTLGVTGNTTLGGNLGVTGTSSHTGAATFGSTIADSAAPTAGATNSLVNLGTAIASGNANGTYIGTNAASGYAGDYENFEVNGSSKFKVDNTGAVTATSFTGSGAGLTGISNSAVNWAAPGTIGSTTPNTGAFSTLSSSGASTLNSAAITNGATVGTTLGVTGNTTVGGTLGVTGNTTLTGTLGAGASTLNSATITNGATVGTTLGVTGNTTLGGNLGVTGTSSHTGAATFGNTIADSAAPTAGATNSLVNLGTAIASGNANGTYIGTNAASGYSGDYENFEVNGTSKFKVDNTGAVTATSFTGSGAGLTNLPSGAVNWAVPGTMGSTTPNTGAFTTLSSSGASTLNSAAVTNNATVGGTLGVTGNTTLSGTLGAGASTLNSATITNGATVGTTLGVTGNTTLGGTLGVTGASTFGSTIADSSAPTAGATNSLVNLGSAIASGNANGTYIGTNAASGYAGDYENFEVNGSSKFKVDNTGAVTATSFTGSGAGLTGISNSAVNWAAPGTMGSTTPNTGAFTTLSSSGASTLNSAAVTNNATVGGTLGVTGNTTLTGTLGAGASTLNSATITNGATVGTTFGVTGNTTLGGTLGVTGASTFGSTIADSAAPTAGATNSLVNLGSAIASGNTNGTYIGTNAASGYAGDYENFEVNGTSKFKVDNTGAVTATSFTGSGAGLTGISNSAVNWAAPGTIGSTTPNTGAFSTLSSSGASTLNSAAITNGATVGTTLGVTGNTTLGGTLGVTGNTTLTGTLGAGASTLNSATITNGATVGTTLGVTGNTTLGGTLGVTGTSSHTGAATFGSTIADSAAPTAGATNSLVNLGTAIASGNANGTYIGTNAANGYSGDYENFEVNGSSKFKVDNTGTVTATAFVGDASGLTNVPVGSVNWAVPGTIGSTTPNTGAFSTLSTSGAATLNSAAVTNNATVGGTLGVTGNTTLTGTLGAGASTLNSATITNAATVGTTLGVTGNTTLGGTLGVAGNTTLAKLLIAATPTATPIAGLVSIGEGAFDGTTSGFFSGSTSGTEVAVNSSSTFAGNLIDLQKAGVSKFSVSNAGVITGNGSGLTNIPSGSVNWAVPGTIGSTTPNTGAFSTLSSSGASTLNSAAITNGATVGTTLGVTGNTTVGGTLGVTGNTTLTGTLGAGASTLNSATITNAATVGTTLGVTGNTTLGGTLGVTGASTFGSTIADSAAPTAGATNSLVNLGTAIASGNANGTYIGTNAASGYAGDYENFEVNGSSKFKVDNTGAVTATSFTGSGAGLTGISNSAVNWAAPGTIGSTTPNTGAFSTLSSSGAATLNSTAVTNNATVGGTLGVTGNTTLTGTLGAGASTLNSATITNAATVGTTLGVTGNTSLGGTLGVTGNTTLAKVFIAATPTATPIAGLVSIGEGGFAGSAGNFSGSTAGTEIAVNSSSSFTGNLIDLQKNGSSQFSVSSAGVITGNGSGLTNIPAGAVNWAAPGTIGSTTPNTGAFSTLSSSGASTLNSAAVTNNATVGGTLGVTGNTTLTGTLGAGASTLNSATITNGATVGTTLGVTGNTTLGGTLGVTGASSHTGAATFGSTIADSAAPTAGATNSLVNLGSAIASGNANGTYIGTNAASGYAGDYENFEVNGSSKFKVDNTGAVTATSFTGSGAGLTGISNSAVNWAAPGTIGSTTPNTGAFSTLSSSGAATLNSAAVTNNATVGGTLGVNGNTTLTGTLGAGASTLNSATITNAATVGTTLGVTGATTLAGLSTTGVTNSGNETVAGTFGVTGNTTLAKVLIAATPTATPIAGLVSIGEGPFDGSTSGFFSGSTAGTEVAVNSSSSFAGNLIDLQKAGVSKFSVSSAGVITGNGSGLTNIPSGSVNWAAPGTIGSTTPNTGAFSTLSSSGAATLNSAAVTNNATVGGTLGVTGNTTLTGTLGAGASTLNSATITNGATVGTTLGVTGNTSLSGTLGVTGNTTLAKVLIAATPTATPIAGLVSIGEGPFDGTTSGFFGGSTAGTEVAVNSSSSFTGNLIDLQKAGTSKFKVDSTGAVTATSFTGSGAGLTGISNSAVNWAAPGTIGSTTPNTGAFSTLSSSGAATLNSAGITNNATVGGTLGVTGASTFSTLSSSGAATLNSTAITTSATVGTTLGVTGNTTLGGTLGVTGNSTLGGTLGVTGNTTLAKVLIAATPTATPIAGLVSIGEGPFDGSTSGFFSGSTAGTEVAVNSSSSFAGNLIDLQKAGVSKFSVSSAGVITGNGSGLTNIPSGSVNWAAPGTIGSTTPNTGAFSTLSSSGLSTLNSASVTTTLGVTGNTTLSGTLSAGASTLNSATITNAATVGTTLGVTGNTSLSGTLGVTGNTTLAKVLIAATPTATPIAGLVSIGEGPFDGSTSGFFSGSTAGTEVAVNSSSSFTGNLIDLQKAGTSKFKVDSTGAVTATSFTGSGSGLTSVPNSAVSWAAPGTIGSTTPNTGAFSTLSSSGAATLNSASVTTTLGVTGNTTLSGTLGVTASGTGVGTFTNTTSTANTGVISVQNNAASGLSAVSFNDSSGTAKGYIGWANATSQFSFGALGASPISFITSNNSRLYITSGGNIGIGTTSPNSPLQVSATPTATPIAGLVSIGEGAFDGTTSGFFSGSTSGTEVAVNSSSTFAGNLIDLQKAGASKFKVDNTGAVTATSFSGSGASLTSIPTSALPAVSLRRVCAIVIGSDNGSALATTDIAPQGRQCYIPYAATVVEVAVAADAGTPTVIVAKNHAGTLTDLTSSALATAASGGIACSNTGGTTGLDATTTCSSTLSTTSIAAGDYIETHSSTTSSTAKRMSIFITYTVN